MLKVLIKKQIMEMLFGSFGKRRKGRKASMGFAIGIMAFLLIYLCGVFTVAEFGMAEAFKPSGQMDLLVAFVAAIGFAFATIGGVFVTYNTVYKAKDNELLLSMPIKPIHILISRLASCFIWNVLYSAAVFLPSLFVYTVNCGFSVMALISWLVGLITIPLISLSLCSVLGYLIAKIAAKMSKDVKNVVVIVLSIAFIVGYFVLYRSIMGAFANDDIIESGPVDFKLSPVFTVLLYPLIQLGRGFAGDIIGLLIHISISVGIFALIMLLMQKTLFKIINTKEVSSKKKYEYKEKDIKSNTVGASLLKKEFVKLFRTPIYLLNCGMGTFMMPVAGIALIISAGDLNDMLSSVLPFNGILAGLMVMATCFLSCMNTLTAPSITLEGKNLWILQTSPVSMWDVILSKIYMHLIMTVVPMALLIIAFGIVVGISALDIILAVMIGCLFVVLVAVVGIALNIMSPKLGWVNETIAVKQNTTLLILMLVSFACSLVIGGITIAGSIFGFFWVAAIVDIIILVVPDLLVLKWLRKTGAYKLQHITE